MLWQQKLSSQDRHTVYKLSHSTAKSLHHGLVLSKQPITIVFCASKLDNKEAVSLRKTLVQYPFFSAAELISDSK